ASFGMGRLGSEGRRPLPTSPPLCRRHRAYNTEHRAGEYRGSSEEDKEHPAPRSPFRHCCPSCFDVRLGDLDSTKAGSGGPDTLCDIVMTVGPGRLLTGSLGTSNELQEGRQRDGQTSSRKL
ncbi:hypothetical protein V3C99_018611, partial [Haemonchus contortus]